MNTDAMIKHDQFTGKNYKKEKTSKNNENKNFENHSVNPEPSVVKMAAKEAKMKEMARNMNWSFPGPVSRIKKKGKVRKKFKKMKSVEKWSIALQTIGQRTGKRLKRMNKRVSNPK